MRHLATFDGVYSGERAAALAGVPESTVYYWARRGVVVPSISKEREKLWSYADLVELRIIYWLRQKKSLGDTEIPATSMPQVRLARERLASLGMQLWMGSMYHEGRCPLLVTVDGQVLLDSAASIADLRGQELLGREFLDVLGPFELDAMRGPNLVRPRPTLRIVPGKISGQPHIASSRVSTEALAALADRGFSIDLIHNLYPDYSITAIRESIELENQLRANLAVNAA